MMGFKPVLVYLSPGGPGIPEIIATFADAQGLRVVCPADEAEVLALVNRSFPACIVMDGAGGDRYIRLCRTLKRDAFSAVVPVVIHAPDGDEALAYEGLQAGADEIITGQMHARERLLRLQMILQRASRDVSVHPTTRLPGTAQIARNIAERVRREELFAVCYADLDHFKEFNDRYGYSEGDRVILMVSRILRDVVKAHAPDGFIGHIGGDDFIFTLPLEHMAICCEEITEIFDQLIVYQYSEEDREAGYFLGRDRRGNLYEVPLMTLSIGVVTNQRRNFSHPGRVSELAAEMKAYAKTLKGSVYAVDRRSDRAAVAADPSGAGPEHESHTPPAS